MQKASGGTNKRSEARKPVNGRGRIVFADRSFADCTIIDTSVSGAHVRLSRKTPLSPKLLLLNIRDRTVHEASVVWQDGDHAGLRFEVSYILGSELPTALDFMRKHWLECAMR